MLRKVCLSLFVILLFAGRVSGEVRVGDHLFETGTEPVFKVIKDDIFLGYYAVTDKNIAYIRNISGGSEEMPVLIEDMKSQYLNLIEMRDKIALVWRPKAGDGKKYIYIHFSEDGGKTFGKPSALNSTTDALLPITTASDGKNRLYVAWVDERLKHHVYLNYSIDGGKTFLEKDINLTPDFEGALLHSVTVRGERVDFLCFGVRKGAERAGIYHRYSNDGGNTWSEFSVVQDNFEWSPFTMTTVTLGGRVIVFWGGVWGLYGAYNDGDGKEWTMVSFPETDKKEINRVSVETKGNSIFLVTGWKTWQDKLEKPSIYFYRSGDMGTTWSAPLKLNTNPHANTSSVFPVIASDQGGEKLLAVWQDHRNIRGDIFLNYSTDSGKTWQQSDRPVIKEQGRYNNAYPYAVEHGGKFYVLWLRFRDDAKREVELYMEKMRVE